MTVVPRQSTTTSALPAPIVDAAPSAATRPSSTRMASASARGAVITPVAKTPMFTRPSVAISAPCPTRFHAPRRGDGWGGRVRAGAKGPVPDKWRRTPRARMEPSRKGAAHACRRGPLDPARMRPPHPTRGPLDHARPRSPLPPPGPRKDLVLTETAVDHGFGRAPVVGLEHATVYDGLRRRVEHLVLELAAAELGADE